MCECGKVMQAVLAGNAYNVGMNTGSILCNGCRKQYGPRSAIFHCMKQKTKAHPSGYDLCVPCALKAEKKSGVCVTDSLYVYICLICADCVVVYCVAWLGPVEVLSNRWSRC